MKNKFLVFIAACASLLIAAVTKADLTLTLDKAGQVDCTPIAKLMKSLDRNELRQLVIATKFENDVLLAHCIFPKIRSSGTKYDIIRAATFFNTQSQREEFIKKARKLEKKSSWELSNLFSSTLNPNPPQKIPAGFILIKEFIGKGKYSLVSLVQDIKTKKLYAWKRSTGAKSNKGDAFRRHVNLQKLWVAAGVTTADMILLKEDTGAESILHEYIGGSTFKRLYLETRFLDDLDSEPAKRLADFVAKIISNRIVFLDLNAKNFVFNGKDWEILDSQRPEVLGSVEKAYYRARELWTEKWTNSSNTPEARKAVEKFFDQFEKKRLTEVLRSARPDPKVIEMAEAVLELHDKGKLLKSVEKRDCTLILLSTSN